MSDEAAYAYAEQLYPPAADDFAYRDGLAFDEGFIFAARFVNRLRRRIKELGAPFSTKDAMKDVHVMMSGNRTKTTVIVEEFCLLSSCRESIAAVLKLHGYPVAAGKEKLTSLYSNLIRGGAGRVGTTYIPAYALYDGNLLARLLEAEEAGTNVPTMAVMAFDYCAGTDLMKLVRSSGITYPQIESLLFLDYVKKKGSQ